MGGRSWWRQRRDSNRICLYPVHNGRDDFRTPAAARERFIELLGTPAANKQQIALDGGHFPQDIRGLVRHTLDWFDKYLGPVR